MTEPRELDVRTPDVRLRALEWGAADAPIALCLHGFPDTAHGWRKVAPILADAGWRVVAPFMRGYAPSSLASDGSYHVGALMDVVGASTAVASMVARLSGRGGPASRSGRPSVHPPTGKRRWGTTARHSRPESLPSGTPTSKGTGPKPNS